MKTRIIIPLTVAVILIGFMIWKLTSNKKKMEDKLEQSMIVNTTIPVITEKPKLSILKNNVSLNGTIMPEQEVFVLSKAQGIITQKFKKTGDRVRKGEPIIQIENTILRKSLAIAQSDYENISKDVQRYKSLQKQGAVALQELERSQMSLREAEERITSLKDQIENTTILSPVSGVISRDFIEEGQLMTVEGDVAHIISRDGLKLLVSATESDIHRINKGQKIKIEVTSLEEEFYGIVNLIAPKANDLHFYIVEILLKSNDHRLKPGIYATANFDYSTNETEQITISRKAIVGGRKNPSVFIVKDGKAYKRKVQTGFYNNEQIEIKSGISLNEIIINSGQINLTDGIPIKILK